MPPFTPQSSLTNPHFETYRLSPSSLATRSIPLPAQHLACVKPTTRVIGSKEARARAAWQRVFKGEGEGEVLYIDEEGNVIGVEFVQTVRAVLEGRGAC
jgi:hypothetical protein